MYWIFNSLECNRLIAPAPIEADTSHYIEGETVVLAKTVPFGHNVAPRMTG